MAKVLIADDEANLRKILAALLLREGHQSVAVADGAAALQVVRGGGIDIVITDLKMPEMSGLELLQAVRQHDADLPVIMITAHGTVDTAVKALKSGASDYITKPFDRDELRLAVRKAVAARDAGRRILHDAGDTRGRFRIIGQSPRMRQVYAIIEKVADTPSTVLITGESGTGKELVATALHENSARRDKPLIKVNCAAIPKDLIESEFFGYAQGAFTGAVSSKPGRFELADKGTLFLDEIAEIPQEMQVKLLRALQESEFERVGGVRTIHVDVRLVAASNRDLSKEIATGTFRDDLFYRLNVVPIALPALRDRLEDIPLLVEAFLDKYNRRLNKQVTGIDEEALAALAKHGWPGNIRELENVIERTLLFAETERIRRQDLPDFLSGETADAAAAATTTASGATAKPQRPEATARAPMKELVRQATVELERDLIVRALDETQGNVTHAATLLGISRKGLQNKMKELGLREDAQGGTTKE